jgi:hypothetical protein
MNQFKPQRVIGPLQNRTWKTINAKFYEECLAGSGLSHYAVISGKLCCVTTVLPGRKTPLFETRSQVMKTPGTKVDAS